MKNTVQFSIRVSRELQEALHFIAVGMECSLNQAINQILTQAVLYCAEYPLEDWQFLPNNKISKEANHE